MIIWIAPVLGFLRSALPYALLFLRSLPDLIAPKPIPASAPFTPPFTDGQCVGVRYGFDSEYIITPDGGSPVVNASTARPYEANGALLGTRIEFYNQSGAYRRAKLLVDTTSGVFQVEDIVLLVSSALSFRILNVSRLSGTGNCGDLANPTPTPSIPDDGLFNPSNPRIGDDNGTLNPAAIVLAPALPLSLVPLISSAIAAALAAARAAASALEAIQKVAEALEGLAELWKKLKEFLDDWEKNRPKKRDIVRQTYGQILGDGAIDFFPNNNTKFKPIQLDVVITNIPIGYGRYFGNLSPNRYRFRELGYIAFYSVNQGILETHSIQFKRTSYQIPELAVGFIYHLGLDEQIRGFAFGTFSVEKT